MDSAAPLGGDTHLCDCLARLPAHAAVLTRCDGREVSGAQLRQRVSLLASALLAPPFSLRPGERVALATATSDSALEAWLAVAAAGGVAAPLNPRWALGEAASAAQRCGAVALLFDDTAAPLWRRLAPGLRCGGQLASPAAAEEGAVCVESLLRAAPSATLPRAAPGGVCTLVFTSGSTGAPKAVALTHAAVVAASAAKAACAGYCAGDVYYNAAPLCHVGGLSSAHAVLSAGGRHLFPARGRFEAPAALRELRGLGANSLILVPTMLHDLLAVAGGDALRGVRRLLLGGGAAPPFLVARAARLFPCADIIGTYALSEACSTLTFLRLASQGAPLPSPGSGEGVCVGAPPPGTRLRVRPGPDGQPEIWACGPQTMWGYWGDGGASEAALRQDGGDVWLLTGDLGRLDDAGRLWLLGRRADVVKSGGENVHASEVEAALQTHPFVTAAAVVALPHERWGEQVAALLALAPGAAWAGAWAGQGGAASAAAAGAALSPEGVRAHCAAAGLAGFKAPRFVAAAGGGLPLGATGKVDRAAVRAALAEALARQGAPRSRL